MQASPVKFTYQHVIFFVLLAACFIPAVTPPLALLMGFILAQTSGNPYLKYNGKITKNLLQYSIILLGFGINAGLALEAGKTGLYFTIASIVITMIAGLLVGRLLRIDSKASYLVSAGTAICGGSAIAALSPIVKATDKQISVALGTVFILNSIALLIFPFLGQWLGLSQQQFGLWAAIAIHDTSSVVGAASKYGEEALHIATTVKLTRALWIIPLALITTLFFRTKTTKIKFPYFILGFVAAIILNSLIPQLKEFSEILTWIAKKGLTITLFFIGTALSVKELREVGTKIFVQGIALWILISVSSLLVILYGWAS